MSSAANERQASGSQKVSSRPQSSSVRQHSMSDDSMRPIDDFVQYLTDYARANPGTAALWCLGIGFVLGWKLKPW